MTLTSDNLKVKDDVAMQYLFLERNIEMCVKKNLNVKRTQVHFSHMRICLDYIFVLKKLIS